ncbi:putative reverse transcriptase domain-containing protein [Tanacetum coccineum]
MPNTRSGASMTHGEIEDLIAHRVAEEIEARKAAMNLEPLNENRDEQEGRKGGNGNRGNGGNGNRGNGGNGNGGNGGNGNGGNKGNGNKGNGENGNGNRNRNHGMNYGGTEGVVGLTRWFEKMETVFNISNCPSKYQVKYATCTLQDSALTWWNTHKRTIGVDAAYAMKWAGLMRLMTEVYCPRNEIQKMETELWNLTMKGNDLTAYTQRFQELILLCTRMVPDEEDKVERFIGGLPDNIQGNVIAAEPIKLQDAIRISNNLMDQKLKGYARSAENKRRAAFPPNTQRDVVGNQPGVICYECGRPGYFRKDCPKLSNQFRGNQTRNKNGNKTGSNEATTKAYAIRGGGTKPDSNVVTRLNSAGSEKVVLKFRSVNNMVIAPASTGSDNKSANAVTPLVLILLMHYLGRIALYLSFMKAFIEESKESTQSRAEKGGAKCRDKATEDSDFLLANRAQYKRMELNLPLKKDICLTQAFRSHFLLKEDRKKLKVEKEGSDVYEQNEPQIEKADQGELQLQLSIGVLRWERK